MSGEKDASKLLEIAKATSLVVVTISLCIKLFLTPMSLTLDAPTLISLLLALFSIGLSALFYFKAAETSNTFYDNTYKFTKDIAQLLSKIESGFGERLRHLDEGYTSMRNYFQSSGRSNVEDIHKTKEKLDSQQEDFKRVAEERDKIIKDLLERSHLEGNEKQQISSVLKKTELELQQTRDEISRLQRKMAMTRMASRREVSRDGIPNDKALNNYTLMTVVERIGKEKVLVFSDDELGEVFDRMAPLFSQRYIRDLEELEFYDGGLTKAGINYLKALVKDP